MFFLFFKVAWKRACSSPELLVGFNKEAQVSVLTQVRSNEHFRCLAALLPKQMYKLGEHNDFIYAELFEHKVALKSLDRNHN